MGKIHSLTFAEFYSHYKAGEIQPTVDTVEITQEINDCFKKISGSTAIIHDDAEHAGSLGYKDKISYGLLYEVVSVACSEAMTGECAVGYEWNVTFKKPLFVGDILNIKCEIESISKAVKKVVQKITVTDNDENVRSIINVKIKFMK